MSADFEVSLHFHQAVSLAAHLSLTLKVDKL